MSPAAFILIARLLVVVLILYLLWSQVLRPVIFGTRLFPMVYKDRRESLEKARGRLQTAAEDLDMLYLEEELKKAENRVQELREKTQSKSEPEVPEDSPHPSSQKEVSKTDQKADQ